MTTATPAASQAEINARLLSNDHLMNEIGKRTVRGGAIGMAAQFVRITLQLASTFVLARLLTPADFGLFAMAAVVMAFISMFTELGISTATIQRQNLSQDLASALLYVNIGVNLAAVLVAALFSPIMVMIFKDDRMPLLVTIMAISAPINAIGSLHYALMQRNMEWVSVQMIALGCFVAGTVAAVVAAWVFHLGYWSLAVQSIFGAIVGAAWAWIACRWRPTFVRNWSGVREALHFGLNLTGTTILNFLHNQSDNALIGWRWGEAQLGYYSRAYSILVAPENFVFGSFASTIVPALSRLQNDPPRWRSAYLEALAIVTAFGGALTCTLFGGATTLIGALFGPAWNQTATIFSFLVIGLMASTPTNTTYWICVSKGRTDYLMQIALMSAPLYLASFLIGLPYGATGVALSYAIARNLAFLPCFFMAKRGTNLTIVDVLNTVLPVTGAAMIVGLSLRVATYYIDNPILDFAAIAVAGLCYCALVIVLAFVWPPYRDVRQRGLTIARSLLNRLRGVSQDAQIDPGKI